MAGSGRDSVFPDRHLGMTRFGGHFDRSVPKQAGSDPISAIPMPEKVHSEMSERHRTLSVTEIERGA